MQIFYFTLKVSVHYVVKGGNFADLICVIYAEFCVSKIIKVGWFLTEVFKSKVVDVFCDTVYMHMQDVFCFSWYDNALF